MDVPVLANQQELIYVSPVWKHDVVWKTLPEAMNDRDGWSELGKYVLSEQLDNDEDLILRKL